MGNVDNIVATIRSWTGESIIDEVLLIALMIAIVESCAQNTIKESDHGSAKFITGLSIYMGVGYLLHYAYHKFPMSKINVIWSCISIILATLLGYALYDEPLNNWVFASVVFAMIAVYCTYKGSE